MSLLNYGLRSIQLAAVAFYALCSALHAQNALPTYPQKFGKITLEELKMQKYAPDSNAHAVYLQNIGKFEVASQQGSFTIIRRIKILDEAGYEEASFFSAGEATVQAVTYNLGPDNTIIETPLEKKDIYKDKIYKGIKGTRFTMPNLKPGCVVEYKFERAAGISLSYSWEFQLDEPVLYTEFSLTHPSQISYYKRYRGYLQELYKKIGNKKVPASTYTAPGNEAWVMENVPAFREKEFLIDKDEYRTSIEFQAESAGYYFITWDKFSEFFRNNLYSNAAIKPCADSRHALDSLLKGKSNDRQKLASIHQYVQATLKWNERYSEAPSPGGPCQALKKKEGNSADMNLLLIGLCRAAGYRVYPVVTSIRGRSRFYSPFPVSSQFNNVLAMVDMGKDTLWLDASQREVPFPHLPEEDLVGVGYLVKEDKCTFIPIPEKQVGTERIQVSAALDTEGKIEGTFSVSFDGEDANDHRETLFEKDEKEWANKTLLQDIHNLSLNDLSVTKTDTVYNRLRVKGKLLGEEYASQAGNELFLNPVLLLRKESNALTNPMREYPVELYMPKEYAYSLALTLPDGYEATSLPKSQRLRLEDGSGEITRVVRYEGGTLGYTIKLALRKTLYSVNEYEALRKLHQLAADMNKEQIQIRKKL